MLQERGGKAQAASTLEGGGESCINGSVKGVSGLTSPSCGTTQQVRPVEGKAACVASGVTLTARSEDGQGESLFKSSEQTLTRSKKRELVLLSSAMSTET